MRVRTDEVPIVAPCEEDWERMSPDAGGRRRFCDACSKHVHDLSAMDERSAQAFWEATAHMDICISYLSDEDGQLLFASPQAFVSLGRVRVRNPPERSPRRSLAAASLGAALAACTPHGDELNQPLEIDAQVLEDVPASSSPLVVVPPARESSPPPGTSEPAEAEETEPVTPETHLRKKGRRVRRTAGIPLRNTEPPLL